MTTPDTTAAIEARVKAASRKMYLEMRRCFHALCGVPDHPVGDHTHCGLIDGELVDAIDELIERNQAELAAVAKERDAALAAYVDISSATTTFEVLAAAETTKQLHEAWVDLDKAEKVRDQFAALLGEALPLIDVCASALQQTAEYFISEGDKESAARDTGHAAASDSLSDRITAALATTKKDGK